MKQGFLHIACSLLVVLFFILNSNAQNVSDSTLLNNDAVIANDNQSTNNETESDTCILRTISPSEWQKIKADKNFIYRKEKKKSSDLNKLPAFNIGQLFNTGIIKLLMFLIVGIVLFFVVYHLFFNGDKFIFKHKKTKVNSSPASFEEVDLFNNWDKALKEAIEKKDYRLAIRVLYLQTLHILNQHHLIAYEQDKTNWDYVRQLASSHYHASFIALTSYFDYVWYGQFQLDEEDFELLQNRYKQFQLQIK